MNNANGTRPWYEEDKGKAHEAVFSNFRALDREQQGRRDRDLHHLKLYSQRMARGFEAETWSMVDGGNRLRLNLVMAVVQTVVAQVATNKMRSMFLTRKGRPGEQQRGKDLGNFILGIRNSTRQHIHMLDTFRDAGIFGSGFSHIWYDEDGPFNERVLSMDLVVDELEARQRPPKMLMRHIETDAMAAAGRYSMGRSKRAYSELLAKLKGSAYIREDVWQGTRTIDPISIIEAWIVKPTRLGTLKGRHVVAASECTLVDEEWDLCMFPVSKFDWDRPVHGFRGIGLSEILAPIQLELNYLLAKIQKHMTLASSQVFIEKSSEVNIGALGNKDWAASTYKGRPPIFTTIQAISPEYFKQVDRLWERGFQMAGVSQMGATGEKPSGLDAAVAIRAYRDVTSRRFLHVQQNFEDFHVHDIDRRFVEAARAYDAWLKNNDHPEGYRAKIAGRRGLEHLRWDQVDLDEDAFIMQAQPVSFLPDEPAGQMQTLKEFGDISPAIRDSLIAKMQYPDLEDAVSKDPGITAAKAVDMIIEKALVKNQSSTPDVWLPPEISIPMVRNAILQGEIDGVSDSRIDHLRQFVVDTEDLWAEQREQAQQGAIQQAMPQAMPGQPGPMPVQQPPGAPAPGIQ